MAYEEYTFAQDESLEKKPGLIQMKKFVEDGKSEEEKYKTLKLDFNSKSLDFDLSSLLIRNALSE